MRSRVNVAAGVIAALLAGGVLAAATAAPAKTRDADLADFDFVTAKVAANYSGWPTKTAGPRRAELDALTARLRTDVERGGDGALRAAIERWLAWFNDGHLRVQWNAATDRPWRERPRRLDEAAARAGLVALGERRSAVEGLWTIDDRYRLAVLRRGRTPDRFDAVVLDTCADGWARGDVKAVLTSRADGRFDLRYGAGDRTEVHLVATLRAPGDVLDVGDFGIWRRVHDDPAQAARALREWPGEDFSLARLDARTLYLRLPSFSDAHAETVRALLAAHAVDLSTTPNLVVDVRDNGGGSDFVYEPLLPHVCTRPIHRLGVDLRVSDDNRRLRRAEGDRLANVSDEAARTLRGESDRMAATSEPFIRREPPYEIVRCDGPRANPARVAVLIDRAASSAESFLLDVRQSRKVTLVGRENSAGVLDYGEMMGLPAPSGRFTLGWATSRSLRVPHDPVDPDGIAPDVRIPADVADPVAFAAGVLADGTGPAARF